MYVHSTTITTTLIWYQLMECFSVDAFCAELSINITLSIHQQRGGTILFENIHFSSTQFELLKAKNRIVVFRRKYRKHSVWQVKNYLWEGFEKIDKFIWKSPYCWMVWNPREERERVMVYVVRRLFCEMTTPGWGEEREREVWWPEDWPGDSRETKQSAWILSQSLSVAM